MSSTQKKGDGAVVTGLAWLLAVCYLPIDIGVKPLCRWAYKNGFEAFLGVVVSLGVGGFTGFYTLTSGYNPWAYSAMGLAAAVLSMFVAYPLLHGCILRPAWNYLVFPFLEHVVWRFLRFLYNVVGRIREFSEHNFGRLCTNLVRLAQFASPGSRQLWANFEETKERDSWFRDTFDFIAQVLVYCSGAILGYLTYQHLNQQHQMDEFLAGAIGVAVWSLTAALLRKFYRLGKRQFIVLALAGATVYQFSSSFDSLADWLCTLIGQEGNLYWSVAVHVEVFVLLVAYGLPLLDLFFNDLLKQIWKFVVKLPEKAYERDENEDYVAFFANIATFVFSAAAVYYTVLLCGLPEFGVVATSAIAVLVGFLAYLGLFHTLKHKESAIAAAAYSCLIAGWETGSRWMTNELWFSWWGAIAAAILAILATAVIGYALIHVVLRALVLATGVEFVGKKLSALHDWIEDHIFVKSVEFAKHNYKDTHAKDDSGYPVAFGHAMNLVAVGLAIWGSIQLVGYSSFWSWLFIVPSVVLTYIFIGKLLVETKPIWVVGFFACVASGGGVVYAMFDMENGFWMHVATLLATIVAVKVTWFFAYPLVFRALRVPGRKVLLGGVGDFLAAVHKQCWDGMVALLEAAGEVFSAISKWLYENVGKPVAAAWRKLKARIAKRFAWLAAIWHAVWDPIVARVKPILARWSARIGQLYRRTKATYARIWARLRGQPVPAPETPEGEQPEGEQGKGEQAEVKS